MVREIITLHIGQAGVQIADPYWRLMCLEHNIDEGGALLGLPSYDLCSGPMEIPKNIDWGGYRAVFQETPRGNVTPRAVIIDPDPDCITTFKRYYDHGLYSKARYVSSHDSCSNLFAKGQAIMYCDIRPKIMNVIRHILEACDNPEGFLAFCSLGGGTGSAVTVCLLNLLQNNYRKLAQVQMTIFPTPKSTIVEPYNCGLHEYIMCGYQRAVIMVDNNAMNNVMRIKRPKVDGYKAINGLVAQMASAITAGTRFQEDTDGSMGLRELQFLLNPTKQVRFGCAAFAPISSNWATTFEKLTETKLTKDCFSNNHQLLSCYEMGRKPNFGTCMIYRGDIDFFRARDVIGDCLRRVPGPLPSGFNMSITAKSPAILPETGIVKAKNIACRFSNNAGLQEIWQNTYDNYRKLLSKKAFLHWYLKEGMTLFDMMEAKESLNTLIDEYSKMFQT